jgi:type IV secretion system protein VirB4
MPPHLRSIAGLCAWLVGEGAGSAGKRLERWGQGGDLAWAFDGAADRFDPDAGLVGVDTSALLGDEAVRGPAAAYLLHRIRSVIDGRRFVLAADEFWAYLPDERFARAFEDFALTLRKGNGALVMATQQPEHVLRHPVGATLVSNCRTKLLFRNADADRAAYCGGGAYDGGLNCTPGEFRAVSEDMLAGPRSVLIKRESGSVVCRVELPEAMADYIAVLSGRAATVRLLRSIRAERGTDDPAVLIPEFRRRLREAMA